MKRAQFQAALGSEPSDARIVQRFILHGSAHAFDESSHFELKQRISSHFAIDVSSEVFVVGSGKLGFSISPSKRWRGFSDESDIDVAIVSHTLFTTVWHELDEYHRSGADWPDRSRFVRALARGWLRPDLTPTSPLLATGNAWWEFFRELKADRFAGPRKIAAGLYHDLDFLTTYQAGAIAACRGE